MRVFHLSPQDAEKRYAQKLVEIEREKAKVSDLESEKNDIEEGLKQLSKESEDYRQRIEELEEANDALERQLRKSSQIKLQFEEYETEMQLKLQVRKQPQGTENISKSNDHRVLLRCVVLCCVASEPDGRDEKQRVCAEKGI